VIEAIGDGTISVISSGHDPRGPEDKRLPFADAEPGMAGAETLLPLTMNLVRDEVIDLSAAFRLLATNPAQLLGVDAGELAVGLQADIAIIDADRPGSSPRPKWPRPQHSVRRQGVQGRVIALWKGGMKVG
jgi:dihydroorotase